MKKINLIFILFLFYEFNFLNPNFFKLNQFCCAKSENEIIYNFVIEDKKLSFRDSDFNLKLSKEQTKNYHNKNLIKKLKSLNFSDEEISYYLYPETRQIFNKLCKIVEKTETDDKIYIYPNQARIKIESGEKGKNIDKIKFFSQLLNCFINSKNVDLKINTIEYKNKQSANQIFREKSCFSTAFSTSSDERKNNIKVALKSLDGVMIEEGEIFSFNELTGERSEKTGYKPAKIISNGTFVLGYGGGVCQVSTTLYNACLLAGLEIVESNSHSLPVSYVEPSFDAMVNSGSSDLKIRNNSGGKIIITTSSQNDICKVKIYGLKNKYKITRQSEKISVISAEPDVVVTDIEKFGENKLEIGEEKRISYAKDGFISRGYLSFYDEKGNLVERKLIRENKYNNTKGIILKREN